MSTYSSPRTKTLICTCAAWLLWCGLSACSGPSDPSTDGETHWAKLECRSNADCPSALECVCNICTRRCDDTTSCGGVDSAAVCASAGADSCSEGAGFGGICMMGCQSDEECSVWGEGHICEDRVCVPAQEQDALGWTPLAPTEVATPEFSEPVDPQIQPPLTLTPIDKSPVDDPKDSGPPRGICEPDPDFDVWQWTSADGALKLSLPHDVTNTHTPLHPDTLKRVITYRHAAREIWGGAVVLPRPVMERGAAEVADDILKALRPTGAMNTHMIFGDTHLATGNLAATAHATLEASRPLDGINLRDSWLDALAGANVDATPGATYLTPETSWRVRVSTVVRATDVVALLAIQPLTHTTHTASHRATLDNLSDVAMIGDDLATAQSRCTALIGEQRDLDVDMAWFIELDQPMDEFTGSLIPASNALWQTLDLIGHTWRAIVSTSEPGPTGLVTGIGWHKGSEGFAQEADALRHETRISHRDDLFAAVLENTRRMLSHATDSFYHARDGVELAALLVADKESPLFEPDAKNSCAQGAPILGSCATHPTERARLTRDWVAPLDPRVHTFALVTDGETCGETDAASYKQFAAANGGGFASLCQKNLDEVLTEWAYQRTGASSLYTLATRPIASTLRVYRGGEPVPRSRVDGYDYFPHSNSLVFFGSWRDVPSHTIQLHYEEYVY